MDTECIEQDRKETEISSNDIAKLTGEVTALIKTVQQQNQLIQEQQQFLSKIARDYKKQTGRHPAKGIMSKIKGLIKSSKS